MEENKHFTIDWTNCRLCPRECGADRTRGFGACKVGNTITAARAALHMWEEPCISGDEGSGAIFFSGCNLGCVYCQNREIALGHSVGQLHKIGFARFTWSFRKKRQIISIS